MHVFLKGDVNENTSQPKEIKEQLVQKIWP